MKNKIYEYLKSGGGGALLGQVAAFLAMLLPIVFSMTGQLRILVVWGAISAILSNFITFGIGSILPVIEKKIAVFEAVFCSLALLVFGCALYFAVYPIFDYFLGLDFDSYLAGGFLTFTQGVYLACCAIIVRVGNYRWMALIRFSYGFSSLFFTLVFCLFFRETDIGLLLSISFGFLASILILLFFSIRYYGFSIVREFFREVDFSIPLVVQFLRRNWTIAFSMVISNLAFNASSLAIPKIGDVGGHWAAILRLAGGVCTVGSQIVAPAFEISLGKVIRRESNSSLRKIILKALVVGLGLAIAADLTSFVLLEYYSWFGGYGNENYYILAALVYGASVIPYSVMNRFLQLSGAGSTALKLAVGKALCVFLLLYFFTNDFLLFSFVILEVVYVLSYMAIVFVRLDK